MKAPEDTVTCGNSLHCVVTASERNPVRQHMFQRSCLRMTGKTSALKKSVYFLCGVEFLTFTGKAPGYVQMLPVCVWSCCSGRLWLLTEMPLSLCSFSPSGDGVWFWMVVQLLAPCLFCLQLFHLGGKMESGHLIESLFISHFRVDAFILWLFFLFCFLFYGCVLFFFQTNCCTPESKLITVII